MFGNVPQRLRAYPNWVNWRVENDKKGKPTKVPINPHTGERASSTNPETWASYETCMANINRGLSHGLGFVLSDDDPFTFIDLDHPDPDIYDPEEIAEIKARHDKIVDAFQTYAEVSPSGKGLHIIVEGKVDTGHNKGCVEMYSRERFMTVTGNVWRDLPIQACDYPLMTLWEEMKNMRQDASDIESSPQTEDDYAVYTRAVNSKWGERIVALFEGRWNGMYASQSDADMAFVNVIAKFTRNHEQLLRIFHRSALGQRAKAHTWRYLWHPKYGLVPRAYDRHVPLVDMTAIAEWAKRELEAKLDIEQNREEKRVEALRAVRAAKHAANDREHGDALVVAPVGGPYRYGLPLATHEQFPVPPGLLGEIASYIYSQSPYPLARVSLSAAIGCMSGICGRAYNINGLGVNTYTLLVAPTAAGKEAMSSGISKIVSAITQHVPSVGPSFGHSYFASGQALYRKIKEAKSILCLQGEFGIELQNLTSPRAPAPVKLLKKAYLELFTKSGAGNTMGASAFADVQKDEALIHSPALSMLCETAPTHLYGAMTEDMISDGFLPRFLIIEQDEASEEYNPRAFLSKPPKRMIERLTDICMDVMKLTNNNMVINVEFDEQAHSMQDGYRSTCRTEAINAHRQAAKELWSRAHAKALKLAALVAIGVERPAGRAPTVTCELFGWAVRIVNDGIHRLDSKFERGQVGEGDARAYSDLEQFLLRYASNEAESLPKSGLDFAAHANGVIPYRYLMQQVYQRASFRTGLGGAMATFLRALRAALDSGVLVEMKDQTGRTGARFFKVMVTA